MVEQTNEKPTRRILTTRTGDKLVVELTADAITMRPPGSRRGGPAEVTIAVGPLYQRLILKGLR